MKAYKVVQEIFIPVYSKVRDVIQVNLDITVMINFGSFRSVFDSTPEALERSDKIKTITIITEGVPER